MEVRPLACPKLPTQHGPRGHLWRDMLVVLAWALGLRLIFALITVDTYDPDEFVILHLSREFSHGATPYGDFMFFHPPGMLVLFRVFEPIVSWWWPSGRLVVALVDTVTAVLVWRIGTLLYGRREALIAGFIYGAHPLSLICGVRIVQDPLITALGMGGLLLLLSSRSRRNAILAGVCLGLAVWIKYPAILFLPVYVLAAPRRASLSIPAFLATLVAVFLPFLPEWHAIFDQTVTWQLMHRVPSDMSRRFGGLAAFWLFVNPLVAPAALRHRPPAWLVAGFGLAALFVMASQVYYHYFVPVVPFAALITAPLVAKLIGRAPRATASAAIALTLAWAVDIDLGNGPSQLFVTATHISAITPTVKLLERVTTPGEPILTDQFEYAYLSNRSPVGEYFWNMHGVVHAKDLEYVLKRSKAVVVTERVAPTYPSGFTRYLDSRRFRQIRMGTTRVWVLNRPDAPGRGEKKFGLAKAIVTEASRCCAPSRHIDPVPLQYTPEWQLPM